MIELPRTFSQALVSEVAVESAQIKFVKREGELEKERNEDMSHFEELGEACGQEEVE